MSAWMHGHDHIDLLVTAIQEWDVRAYVDNDVERESIAVEPRRKVDASDPDATGRMLLEENAKSVLSRYGDDPDDGGLAVDEQAEYAAIIASYSFERVALAGLGLGALTAVAVIKAAESYTYQSCEHDGWVDSDAHALTEALIASAIHRMPGWDEADTWEFTRKQEGS